MIQELFWLTLFSNLMIEFHCIKLVSQQCLKSEQQKIPNYSYKIFKLHFQMAQNVQISTTYNLNSESIQLDDLSLPNEPNVNKTTIFGSSTPQRIASDTFTSPNPPLNNENKILKSIRSSKIPTIKKSLVMTTKTETNNGLNLRSLIGPIRKSILPVAK